MKINIKTCQELVKQIRKPVPAPGCAFKSKKQYARKSKWGNRYE